MDDVCAESYLNIDFKIFNNDRLLVGGSVGNELVPGGDIYLGFAYQPVGVLGLFIAAADGKVQPEPESSVDDICQDSLDSAYETKSGEPAFICRLEIDGKLAKSERAPTVAIAKQAVKVAYCNDLKTPMTHAAYETALSCMEDGTF